MEGGGTGGRHVVAAKKVQAGDTLAVEEPFAAVLHDNRLGSHCDHCFLRVGAAVSCPRCAGVAYCR